MTLNPRGTLWANDDNKFGQKLMEKMGWSKGSGLGREQQGIKEHLTVKFKDDNKGIGFAGSDDEWIKHYEGFESVLANLNSQENITVNASGDGQPNDNKVTKTSLESSSKASKARVHYHKFTRGKDLSQCSEDDLGCILGSKRAKQLAETKTAEVDLPEPEDEVGTVEHSMGVTTIKGCSIQEYFAQKMESLRNGVKNQPQPQEGGNEYVSEETVERPGFGAGCDGREDLSNFAAAEEEVGEKKKKKKKKKQQVKSEDMNAAETGEKSDNCIEAVTENVPKKKKKKRRQEGIISSAVDVNVCSSNEENIHYKPVDSEKTEKRKKKKKCTDSATEENSISDSALDSNRKSKKKKRKYIDVNEEICSQNVKVQEHHEIEKKKKKKKDNS